MTLTRSLAKLIFFFATVIAVIPSYAAVSCSVTVTPISTVYDPTVATENISTGTVTVSCTRAISDPNTFAYSVTADNGLQPNGSTNRVQLAANRYNYELYRTTPYTNGNRWQLQNANRITGTINFGAGLAATNTAPFDLRIPPLQTIAPAGTYTDTVSVTLRNSGGTTINATAFGVSVITSNSCQLSTPPGSLNFSYTSFQGSPVSQNTTFQARCTSGLPYTVALDATSGNLLGLNYSLSVSPTGRTGSGVEQSFTITGTIAAGQGGTCALASCNGSESRTLTVTY
jgi:spore coat protein U-like protein